jgi:hypothetical protein
MLGRLQYVVHIVTSDDCRTRLESPKGSARTAVFADGIITEVASEV